MSDTFPQDLSSVSSAVLAEITAAITSSLDVGAISSVVAAQLGRLTPYDSLAILLLEASSPDLLAGRLTLVFNRPALLEANHSWPLATFSFAPDLLAGRTTIVANLSARAAEFTGDALLLNALGRMGLIVPIKVVDRVLGAMILGRQTPLAFSAADGHAIEPVASLLALALEHQRLDQQASALAVVEERNRLAREIHDTLAQSLTGIIINLESLKPYNENRDEAEADTLAETEILARGALAEARRSVLGLQPTPLQHQSLREALAPELLGLAKRANVDTQFYTHGVERPLPPDVATALFRVAQEAFQNIYKHAAARHAILGLDFADDAVTLTVEDDGIGFARDMAEPDEAGGFGLLSMAARARSLGGDLVITSRPGHGAAIRATVPFVRPPLPAAAVAVKGSPAPTTTLAPEARPIRVLIIDDQPLTRQGIQRILEKQQDVEVVGEAENGLVAIELAARLRPDVALLDLQMPMLSGIDALPRLRAAYPGIEVVILTMFDQDEQVFAGLKAGARGYVLKDAPPETIIAAVRAASQGQSALAPGLATRLVERFSVMAQREVDPNSLTERELEVLNYMARGLPYKEIALQLNISTHTVQYHVTNVLQKLGASSRSEAVATARQRGLLRDG